MITKLLAVAAGAAVLSLACFAILKAVGGAPYTSDIEWGAPAPQITRDLPWTGGPRVDIAYPAEITYTQGPQPRFTVTGPKALVDQLTLEGGALRGPEPSHFRIWDGQRRSLKIQIVSPNTYEFHLAGAERFELVGFDQDQLILDCAGAAHVHGEGHAKSLKISLAGANHVDFGDLPVDDAVVSIAGAGHVELDPRKSADVSISGAGHVDLKTRPPDLRTHIAGVGSVSHP
jgi:hypothetical protein